MTAFAMFLQQSLQATATPAGQTQRRLEVEQRVFDRTGRCAICSQLIAGHFDHHNRFVGCEGAH